MAVWNIHGADLVITQGDITAFDGDAVVNAANPRLEGGGGVDGAVQAAAGPALLKAGLDWVKENGWLPTGGAVATPGFNLKAAHVVHTVGPIWGGGNRGEDAQLHSAYVESLKAAAAVGAARVAFPAISCGAYGYPLRPASAIALRGLEAGLALPEVAAVVREVTLVLHGDDTLEVFTAMAEQFFGEPHA